MIIKVDVFCGSKMRQARHINNMTLDDLANKLNMEKSLLWQFEKGMKIPTKEEENILAKSLFVEPLFFYMLDTSPITEEDCTFSVRMKRM